MAREDYEVVMGLEVHAELSTKTKIFCSCPTKFGAEPNTQVCPICMAMPGTLPKLNEKVVEYAVRAGLATNCEISRNSKNDRKNYFYPDLPKAYQISQYDKPLCEHGYIEIETSKGKKKIGEKAFYQKAFGIIRLYSHTSISSYVKPNSDANFSSTPIARMGISSFSLAFLSLLYPLIISCLVVSSPKCVLEISPLNFFHGRFSTPSEKLAYSIILSTVDVSNFAVLTTR